MHTSAAGVGTAQLKGPHSPAALPRHSPALPSAPQLPNSPGERWGALQGAKGEPTPRSPRGSCQLPQRGRASPQPLPRRRSDAPPRGARSPGLPGLGARLPRGGVSLPGWGISLPALGEPTPWGAPLPLSSPFAPPSDSPELPGCPSLIYPRRQPDRRQRLGAPEQMSSIRAWVNQGRAPGESIDRSQAWGASFSGEGAVGEPGERGSPLGS